MALIKPRTWRLLNPSRFVLVQWPHPGALTDPKHFGEMTYRDGTVTEKTKYGVMVRLDSGGAVEIRNLDALLIDESPEDKKMQPRKGVA